MIEVVETVSGSAINIEVVGSPRQYRLRTGKFGKWAVARGRYKGREHEGVRWGRPSYHHSLKMLLEAAIAEISEAEGLPETAITLNNAEKWQQLVYMETQRQALIMKVDAAYQDLLQRHNKLTTDVVDEDKTVPENIETGVIDV